MRKIFFLCLSIGNLLIYSNLSAQAVSAEQTEQLFKLSQLWGHITYFHPSLQYKKIPFDSAFAAMVPKVLSAKGTKEYTNALNEWLSVLNDPITFGEEKKSGEQKFKADFQRQDSIVIISISGNLLLNWNSALNQFQSLADSLQNAQGVILDFHKVEEPVDWLIQYSGLESKLFTGSITTAGSRSVAYKGFMPETGGSSGGYTTYFKIYPPRILTGQREKNLPVVFIASPSSVLPDVAWAMRKAGLAAIISNGRLADAQNALSYEITEGVIVHFRIREPIGETFEADVAMDAVDDKVLIDSALMLIEKKVLKKHEPKAELPVALIERKPEYPKEQYPSLGWRVLAAAKIYSVINYFFPNKKLMTVDWDSITRTYLPRLVTAKDSAEYQLTVSEMYAHIQDGHGFTTAPITNFLIGGEDLPPVEANLVEEKLIVTSILDDSLAKKAGVEKGDIILRINGEEVHKKINIFKKYRAGSNDSWLTSTAAKMICAGPDSTEGIFSIQKKNGKIVDVKLPYSKKLRMDYWAKRRSRHSDSQTLRFLTSEIGYANLDVLQSEEVDSMFEMFKNAKAIVFDMRGYPKGTAWTISPRLTNKPLVAAAKFTRLDRDLPLVKDNDNDLSNYETWTNFIQHIPKPGDKWQYKGKTVMLINEETMSQAEHTSLFFRAANGTQFIGSQTAGANGDVTNFIIPGEIRMYFSGQTVWFPDGKQLQQVGLVPDIYVRPTIKGIQAGRDEVLERAIKFLQTGK